ncbi:sensor histidine kinase [Bacillus sp. Au-Bac7]|uniref:sensor histidine kinase n=1 Tax=Bacillus sp. Au-Bac7 TaxID=2906458 RepID=UPI001E43FB64|nr:HAMP domain-containing sensor histidine kinase [Bacillus sp. Au-Bac7]MCE4048865.1 HAMP domain-containing histidine kinase [Bacillus sp. Au-Bac7]
MFTKLRNRFLIANMATIIIIMLAAFISIYIITCQKVNSDININLEMVSDYYHKKSKISKDDKSPPSQGEQTGFSKDELLPCFELRTDDKWNILSSQSKLDLDNAFYERVIEEISTSDSSKGRLKLNDTNWAYMVEENQSGYYVYALDVTAELKVVDNLIYTFILVGIIMLIIVFIVNRFLANRYIAPVKEAFNKQKQFISDASHELKTPLSVIHTNTDVLLSNQEDLIANQLKWIHHIKTETERMKLLTNDLLYLAEMDDKRSDLVFAPFNISKVVESVILTMEGVIYEKEVNLEYHIEPELNTFGNVEQMKQLVMILIDNAIKYTNLQGLITVDLRKRHNEILLEVTNTGEGIISEHLEKIFDRFYRNDPSRSRKNGGNGLGLAIAKSIVEKHKGKITVKSTPGGITTFTVRLS